MGLLLLAFGEMWTFTSSWLLPEAPGTVVRTTLGTFGQAVKSRRNRYVPAKVTNVRLHPCRLRMGRLKVPEWKKILGS